MQVLITKDVLTVYGALKAGDVVRVDDGEAKMLVDLGVASLDTASAKPSITRRKKNVSRYDNRGKCGNP